MLKALSILGLLVVAAAVVGLGRFNSLVAPQPITIALQVGAIALMVWARLTFGLRSFHASADPTAGGLIMTGPYRFIRHPIYTTACVSGLVGVVTHLSVVSLALGILLVFGSVVRMLCEERMLRQSYPEYLRYAKVTKRMLPYVF